ncbi:hypothetical protein QO002_006269 [Pararhizobium capsulatum DSM 1112]|uniref:Uncharacterized protein n=1 Tax=Pararhizobium capsulatum DSM 1112 TaxID=1121113 RepID=A0ABU0C1H0_9HYPH|nr:hypothetical protein [Pararhizobium capsulatum DSM 1112]
MASTVAKMIKDDGGEHDVKTVGGCVLKAKENMGKITLTDEADGTATVLILTADDVYDNRTPGRKEDVRNRVGWRIA